MDRVIQFVYRFFHDRIHRDRYSETLVKIFVGSEAQRRWGRRERGRDRGDGGQIPGQFRGIASSLLSHSCVGSREQLL